MKIYIVWSRKGSLTLVVDCFDSYEEAQACASKIVKTVHTGIDEVIL
jgi:hypothetical protein